MRERLRLAAAGVVGVTGRILWCRDHRASAPAAQRDYRAKLDARYKLTTLDTDEFIRRFLIRVLPDGFHRIRHYGLFANGGRAENSTPIRSRPR